jgi:hypothetical protein
VAASALLVLSGCSSEPTRDLAASLISQEKTEVLSRELFLVEVKNTASYNRPVGLDPKLLDALAKAGFFERRELGYYPGDPDGEYPGRRSNAPHDFVRWFPTDKLKPFTLPTKNTNAGVINLKLGDSKLHEVTGIAKVNDSLYRVEFTWKWAPTDIGKVVAETYPQGPLKIDVPQKAIASLTKFDDGWRLSK